MMNTLLRFSSLLLALAFIGFVGCKDSGHSLGDSRDHDAGLGDTPVSTGGSTWSYGPSSSSSAGGAGSGGSSIDSAGSGGRSGVGGSLSSAAGNTGNSSAINGGSSGGSTGQGGSSAASDAGANSDTATKTCGDRGDSCANRPCCGPLVCMNFTSPPSCYESMPPLPDAGRDMRANGDTQCPACPPMKCAYGSPVDSNGCTLCQCNPAPDGGADTTPRTDADLSTPCPSTPPSNGSPCLGQGVCNYEDCPGAGHTKAMCRSDKWVVNNGACGTVICLGVSTGKTCLSGQVCIIHAGGALLVDCIDNPCGSGLVSPDCSPTTQGCTAIFETSSGLTFYCNTCPSGTCA